MSEILKVNVWALKEKELLEKLSLEISRDFSISEKLAKKLIFETHLNLDDLKQDIKEENKDSEESIEFDKDKLDKLLFALKWAKEFIENASKQEIEELKTILEKKDIILSNDSEIIKKLFPEKLINKAKNPQNISDQIMWISLGITNSVILISDILYNLWKWIITSIPDFISILSWTWEIESIKKI